MERVLSMDYRTVVRTMHMILAILLALVGSACSTVCDNVSKSYQREFGELVPKPACPPQAACSTPGQDHLTTTAYLPTGVAGERRLLVMHLTKDGTALQTTYQGHTKDEWKHLKPIPAGTFKVLTVLATYAQTVDTNGMTFLDQAQAAINQQHASFAASRGYASPIVKFVFTNAAVPGSQISDPRSLAGVSYALGKWNQTKQLNISDFDFVVVLNLDPNNSEGGASYPGSPAPYFVYVGNYLKKQTNLTATEFTYYASTAYHHEIGHYWGWDEDWTPCNNSNPFITLPILFGWEDTDGDGIPEILDPTPYGRTLGPAPPTNLQVQ